MSPAHCAKAAPRSRIASHSWRRQRHGPTEVRRDAQFTLNLYDIYEIVISLGRPNFDRKPGHDVGSLLQRNVGARSRHMNARGRQISGGPCRHDPADNDLVVGTFVTVSRNNTPQTARSPTRSGRSSPSRRHVLLKFHGPGRPLGRRARDVWCRCRSTTSTKPATSLRPSSRWQARRLRRSFASGTDRPYLFIRDDCRRHERRAR